MELGALVLRVAAAPWALSLLLGRTDVETPLGSLDGVAEGLALRELGLTAHEGSSVHASPLLQLIVGPFLSLPPSLRVLPFVFADALSALFIARAAKACAYARLKSPQQPENGHATTWATPRRCALLYLWNPCSAAACIGNTWSSLETCIMLAAISSALDRRPKAAALCLALAIHFSLHPVVLAVPLALLVRPNQLLFLLWLAMATSLISLASAALVHQHGGAVREWIDSTYGYLLRADDLSPNMGLWWYFFAEIFDHFRAFFLFVFHVQPLLLLVPLTLRLQHNPLVLTVITCLLITLFKPYPGVADLALCFALLPLLLDEERVSRALFAVLAALLLAGVLNPVLWGLWVQKFTGNANFVLATSVVHSLALTTAIVDVARSALV